MAESPEYQHYGGALVEKVAERMQRSLTVDSDETEKYHGYIKEGKQAARQGDMAKSLEFFKLAHQIHPSEKLKSRIKMIQQAVEEIEQQTSESEDEEFVNVNNSGLMLFKELHEKLYEHQKEGIAFLYGLHRDGRKGGILADDMGLGKTIQIIGFLSGMYDAELIKHTLLVMPTSLIGNWTKEFAKWTPGMRVKEFHGSSKTERNRNLEKIQRRGGVVITTYQMLINNWDLLSSYNGQEFKWDYVILDEAHKIKTSSTKTSKSAHAIPAKHRILLTGTPVQNNLREMWALFDFACQGSLLGTSKTFKAEYENPITRAREKDATPGERALGLKISENLMSIISPYFLRRTKQEVQNKKETENVNSGNSNLEDKENRNPNSGDVEMPSLTRKNDFIVWTYLSAVQEDIYNQFISLDHIKELLMTTRSPLAQLNILKKLCDHPRLLSARAVAQLGLQEGIIPDQENDDENESAACRIDNISDEILVSESGKLTFLVALLERLREEGCRTLVFSQSRKMLDIIDRVLVNRGFKILRIDGTVIHLQERERRIDLFQKKKDYSVFLLTTQVGGVGLTLTAANRVVIFDPSWNPATDAQAVDRAYRIGQKENVVIYRLITCATVEEKIYRRQVFKDSLIRQTTGDKKNPFRYFSQQELKELFKLENTRSSSTQLQLQSMHSKHRRTDPELDEHLAYLHTMEMFGISDHDLMFSQDTALHEDCPEDEESHVYIENRVQKAHELMKAESELHKQFVDNIATSTEPAHLRKSDPSRTHGKPVKAELTFPVVISSSENEGCSSVVDLTQSISDNEEHAQNISPKTTFMKVEPTSPTVGTSTLNFSHTGSNTEEQVQNVSMKLTDLVLIDDNAEEDSAELKVTKEGEITKKNSTSSFNQSLGTSTDKINVFDTSVQEVENSMSFSIVHEDAHEKDKEDAVADFRNKFSSANLESIEEPPKPQSLSLCDSPTMDERVPLVKSVNLRLSGLQKLDYELDCFADESLKSDSNAESLQGNFNLQLEDSDYGECPENKASALDETGHGIHLQGETSLEEKGQSPVGSVKYDASVSSVKEMSASCTSNDHMAQELSFIYSVHNKKKAQVIYDSDDNGIGEGEDQKVNLSTYSGECQSSVKNVGEQQDISLSPVNDTSVSLNNEQSAEEVSFICSVRKKRTAQVISDSDNNDSTMDKKEDNEVVVSSAFIEPFEQEGPSTPRHERILACSTPNRKSFGGNTSVASRRSFIDAVMDDVEDLDEELEEEQASDYSTSEAEMMGSTRESVMEEEEPSGETLNTDNEAEENGSELHSTESEVDEVESVLEESTGDVELASDEMMEQCTREYEPSQSTRGNPTVISRMLYSQEKDYENFVKRGKEYYSEGKLKEALEFFIKALDIKSGDPQIQLMTIQLYRQLSQN
ncbi:DNA excision repair protein ERCC-6-like [Scleropages formosus]|uniref:DNA excision repair protein ERCC-6-like n=1 Tax=Scleropages formosus TaxID=113540 RepID=A0A8C9RM03_SCLFO|nr:DNA excision repair protein ERCC-6-like [Scleropages formosus]